MGRPNNNNKGRRLFYVYYASSFGTQKLIDYVNQIRGLVKEADFVKSRDFLVVKNVGIDSVLDKNRNCVDKLLIVMGPTQTMQYGSVFYRFCIETGPIGQAKIRLAQELNPLVGGCMRLKEHLELWMRKLTNKSITGAIRAWIQDSARFL